MSLPMRHTPLRPYAALVLVCLALPLTLPLRAAASQRSELLYSRGIVELHADHPEAALDHFDQAVAADPADGHAWYYRGLARMRLDQVDAAIEDLRRAIELLPAEPAVAYELGLALTQTDAHAEALPYLRQATQDTDLRARAALVLGLGELRLGNLAAADDAFVQATADPSIAARARFYRGVVAFRRGAWDDATAHFAAVTEMAPDSTVAEEAQAYLQRLRSAESTRGYQLFAETGLQYDSNVCLAPDSGCEFIAEEGTVDEADGRAIFSAGGRYTLWRNPEFALSTGYELFQSLHFDLSEFDLQNHRPDLQFAFRRGAVSAGIVARYDFFLRDNDSFLHEVNAVPWLGIDSGRFGRSELHYRLRDREFIDDTFDDRSGLNHALGVRQVYPLAQMPGSHVALGLRYDHEEPSSNGAEAQRFAYDGIEGNVEARWVGPAAIAAEVGYALRYENYDDVSADFDPGFDAREDTEHLLRAEVEIPLLTWLAARIGYYGTFNDSNQSDEFDYERHVASATLALSY